MSSTGPSDIEAAIAAMDRLDVPPEPAPTTIQTFAVLDWDPDELSGAVNRLIAAATGKPVCAGGAMSLWRWNAGLEIVVEDSAAISSSEFWKAVDQQDRRRQNLARAMASALRAVVRISMISTNPLGVAKAAYDLATTIRSLLNALE